MTSAGRVAIRAALSVWAALAIVLITSAPALATPGVAIDPTSAPPLATLKITGAGFCPRPCSAVTITIGSLIVESGVAVDSAGRFLTFVQVPDSTRPPTAPVIASQTDASGNPVQARRSLTVTPSSPPPVVYPTPTSIQTPTASPLADPSRTTTTITSSLPAVPTTRPAPTSTISTPLVASTTTPSTAAARAGAKSGTDSDSGHVLLIALALAVAACVGVAIWWSVRRAR